MSIHLVLSSSFFWLDLLLEYDSLFLVCIKSDLDFKSKTRRFCDIDITNFARHLACLNLMTIQYSCIGVQKLSRLHGY